VSPQPFPRQRRARRLVELSLAVAVALGVVAVTPTILEARSGHSNQAAAAGTVPPASTSSTSSTSTTVGGAAPVVHHFDAVNPVTTQDEATFRLRWSTEATFRAAVAYASATPGERAALDAYLSPPPPPPPPPPPAPAPKPRPVVAPAPAPAVAPAAPGSVWDRLAWCESSGNWAAHTGNGYSGGLQFADSTWRAYGGLAFAPQAWMATRDQQIAVAERIHAASGNYRAWPACSAKLGL